MPGALSASGDGFEFPQNAVYEAGMVWCAQGRGLRRNTAQIGCDLACVLWELVPLPAKETSQLFNAIRKLLVPCECGAPAAACMRSNLIFENGLGKAQPDDPRFARRAAENREFDGDCFLHALRIALAFQG